MEQNTVVESPAASSVEITENAKGGIQVTVKAYATYVQDAAVEALQTYYRTRAVIDLCEDTQNDPTRMIMEQFEIPEE